jgi:hypothetical protein
LPAGRSRARSGPFSRVPCRSDYAMAGTLRNMNSNIGASALVE